MKRIYGYLGVGFSVSIILLQSPVFARNDSKNVLNNIFIADYSENTSNNTASVNLGLLMAENASQPEFNYQDIDFWSNQCHVLENAQKYDEALAACEKAIALKPKGKNIDLWISRSNVLMQQQRYAEAVASYDQVLKREPKNSFALTQRCEALSILGNNSDAIAYCEEALQVDGSWGTITPATAWFNRGVVLRKLTRPEEALTSFERAVNLNSNYSVALAEQCGTLIDLQRYEEATKACDFAIKTNENWGKDKEAIAWNNKALALFNLGKMSEAVVAYEHALAINPNDVTSWDNQGMLLHKMGQYEKALVSYNRATEINPKYSLAFAHRCETLNRLQRYEEALSDCDRAVALASNLGNETLAYLWHQRTNALLGLQKYETALDAAERAIALKLNYAEAWSNKGVILWNLKKYEDALTATKRAVDINPKYVQGWYNYGRVLSSLQDYQQAIVAYDQALNTKMEESVDNLIIASIWANKGASLWRVRKYQLALNSTNEAIKINPESFEGWYNKGVILLDLAKYDEALVAYYKANDLNERNASVWTGIGMALAKSGKPQAALKAFESALNINPNYSVAQRARDALLSKL
ncbi:tetratricopeptide repeat protein [Nostoc sp. NMS9]|uniref:tetratricopeptide repeat protein n=1 Tax=Nostoc sp. NMS9 TaxID=2815393 RepID=UPI0025F0AA34|nr:tetratricopeptide repeat protein [Nostoc sp. NMS9]MBN3941106.1 tetratricopeptide repeat protein [Nostoc sp. NMS9]